MTPPGGYRPRVGVAWLLLLWAVPLGFLLAGYWPIGIVPMTLFTLWLLLRGRRDGQL